MSIKIIMGMEISPLLQREEFRRPLVPSNDIHINPMAVVVTYPHQLVLLYNYTVINNIK